MTASAHLLPHWDVSEVFPSLDSPDFNAAFQSVLQDIDAVVDFFDQHGIAEREPVPLDTATIQAFHSVIERFNAVLGKTEVISAYIYSFVATDSRNELAQARLSELQQHAVKLSLLATRLTAWIGGLDVETLIERSSVAKDNTFTLRKAKIEATHLMSPTEEALAAELNLTSGSAWSRLYSNFTSQLIVTLTLDGEKQELPMSAVRNLLYDPRREVRRQAYEAEIAVWKGAEVPLAAALNSIKGEVNLLTRRRGWSSALEATLFDSNIDRETLEAMMTAAEERFPDFRRYLRAKARALGLSALTWYDLYAPVASDVREWSFQEAGAFIVEQFGTYSPRLRDLAQRAFGDRWIDAEPRPGKRDGAFCMRLWKDESRILANFKPAFRQVSTLAHELGHAYHNLNLADRTPLQRETPMTLAETASTFCETIVKQAALRRVGPQEQIAILEGSLQDACLVVVGQSGNFLFERSLFEKRQERELSPEELTQLNLEAVRHTYGDGLDPNATHPYRWAVVGHYYSTGISYYNFPYMFGLLFGLGLYAHYLQDPEAFRAGYDHLLASTGMGQAAELAGRFGIDIHDPAFWRSSLDVIRADIDRFESLVDQGIVGTTRMQSTPDDTRK